MGGKFSPFYYTAWVCAVAAIFTIYTGYILPNWLKKPVQVKGQAPEQEKEIKITSTKEL